MNHMKKVLFYFHGFGSSKESDKVQRLKDMGYEVYAWDIDIDPSVSLPYLMSKLDDWIIDNWNRDTADMVFVGSSLGGWYANKLGYIYNCKTVLINPSLNPKESLKKFNVDSSILERYDEAFLSTLDSVIYAEDDEVIKPNVEKIEREAQFSIMYSTGGHRFNGPQFERAIREILSWWAEDKGR